MQVTSIVFTSLFTALIAAGAFLVIPVGVVPITLQTMFVILAGLLGGMRIGTSAAVLYLLLGTLGLPIFSGGTGGIGHLLGPTGGYLVAWVPAAFIAGFFSDRTSMPKLPRFILGSIAATLVIYLLGVPWLKFVLGLSWSQAAAAGALPFLPGDILKVVAAVSIARILSDRVKEFLTQNRTG